MKFTEKIENYWYHYKWQTLLGLFGLVVFSVCLVQCAGRETPDAMIMYAGNYKIADDYREKSLESIMKEDYNGDGKKSVDVFQLVINIVEKDGKYEIFDPVSQSEEMQRVEIELATGDSVIYLLHPYIYEQYRGMFRPLSEVLDEVPAYAVDDTGIPVSELISYMQTTLNFYPENSILCLRRERTEDSLMSKKDDHEYYENNVKFFRDIVKY